MLWAEARPACWPHLPPCVRALRCGSSKSPPPPAQGLRRIPFACHPPSPPPRRLRGGFPSTPPGRPECDATPLRHPCHPPSAARTRLRPQSLRTRPSPPRTPPKPRRASGSRALVDRRPGSCSYPRRRPQVHRSSWRPSSFWVQGPLQRPRQRQRGTRVLPKLLRRNQRRRKRRHQRLRSRSGANPPILRLSPRRFTSALPPTRRETPPPLPHHGLACHRPPRLFRTA